MKWVALILPRTGEFKKRRHVSDCLRFGTHARHTVCYKATDWMGAGFAEAKPRPVFVPVI
jgi:hypothetical protein